MAERTSGCRNASSAPSMLTRPASIAGPNAAAPTSEPTTRAEACRISCASTPSSTAATRSTCWVSLGRSPTRAANACSSRAVTGTGTADAAGADLGPSAIGSSRSASGLPAGFVSTSSRNRSARSGALAARRSVPSSSESGKSRTSSSPSELTSAPEPFLAAATKTIGSCSSCRAVNAMASRLSRSSQWASSTTISRGFSAARSASSVSVASPPGTDRSPCRR